MSPSSWGTPGHPRMETQLAEMVGWGPTTDAHGWTRLLQPLVTVSD